MGILFESVQEVSKTVKNTKPAWLREPSFREKAKNIYFLRTTYNKNTGSGIFVFVIIFF